MSFPNEVYFEASAEVDGVIISVKECAQYMSDISFEDAWVKANELAKQKAESKLQEALEKMKKEKDLDIVHIKGCPGPRGYPGPRGPSGAQTTKAIDVVLGNSSRTLGKDVSDSTNTTYVTIDSNAYNPMIQIKFNNDFTPIPGSNYYLNITFTNGITLSSAGYMLFLTTATIKDPTLFYTITLTGGDLLYNCLASNQGPGTATPNTLYIGNGTDTWAGMFTFVSNGSLYIGNSTTTNPSPTS
jgi:hypothetical protein